DHLAGHRLVGETAAVDCVASDTGWWNVCSLLDTDPPRRFYHRGFPLSRRWQPTAERRTVRTARVAVTAGLWLGDPDADPVHLVVAGGALRGHKSGFTNFRYDDIWMSYFAKLAVDRMGDLVTFGRPLVVQERNPHDLLTDLDRELVPMFLTEHLVEILRGIEL